MKVKNSKCLPKVKLSGNICSTCHAEEHVCKYVPYNFKNRSNKSSDFNIVVFRYHKGTKELAPSRPCFRCIKIMQKRKIKNVYYSTAPECIEKEKVANMDSKTAHISSGIKKYMSNRHK
jgi:hypothetical protein